MQEKEDVKAEDIAQIIPPMGAAMPPVPEQKQGLVTDEMLLGVYGEMLDLIRKDREETSDLLNQFLDMIMNEGDGSSAAKEAVVQLMKIKVDGVSNMKGVADLMTRVYAKDRDTFPKYLNSSQTNNISIGGDGKKDLIKILNKRKKEEEKARASNGS